MVLWVWFRLAHFVYILHIIIIIIKKTKWQLLESNGRGGNDIQIDVVISFPSVLVAWHGVGVNDAHTRRLGHIAICNFCWLPS